MYRQQIAITDGGYADNSGMATLDQIALRLHHYGVPWNQIYVVYISSNPVEGFEYKEGGRFDSGRLTASLLAPVFLMETARAGRATAFVYSAQTPNASRQVIEWPLSEANSSNLSVAATQAAPPPTASTTDGFPYIGIQAPRNEAQYRDLAIVNAKRMPPLGWTLDETAARGINVFAISHSHIYNNSCRARYPLDGALCKAIMRE